MPSRSVWILLSLLLSAPLLAQEGYRLPPPEVVKLVDAPPPPSVALAPDHTAMLLVERSAMPSIDEMSRRMLRLAGMRIDPAANGRHRSGYDRGLRLRGLDPADAGMRVPLPEGGRLASVRWSHDAVHFMFTVVTDAGTELWAASRHHPDAPVRLTGRLNTVMGGPIWMPDGKTLLARLVPAGRGPEPARPSAPTGPNVQQTQGKSSPLRTYQDLLASPYDEALFEHYATAQLALFPVAGGAPKLLGEPAIFRGARPSPDGRHLLVTRVLRPFSYLMPVSSFPQSVEAWSAGGRLEKQLLQIPLAEDIPIGGVRTGPRSIGWMSSAPATLVWAEALDGGDPKTEVEHRDRWMAQAFPFTGAPVELLRVEHRAQGLVFLRDPVTRVLAGEFDRDRRWTRTTLHDLVDSAFPPVVLEDRSIRDRYADPGRILFETRREDGVRFPVQQGGAIFRSGSGASPDGLLPFLARQDLATGESEELWRCEKGSYESVVSLDDRFEETLEFVTRYETPAVPPNYRTRDLDGGMAPLTDFPDPTPQIRGIHKELVTYKRSDGVPLSATLYLPAGYRKGTRLPMLVWAYPIEFNDPRTAGQVSSSPWRFTRIAGSSHLHLLTQGYAIMDGATMPIIGDAETMNDTFVEQIVGAAQAAIDKAVDMGVADRDRVAAGGHSYGAFMTANLLAHCDLFAAGVARSGAYNRTLTPFGFQSERRTLWEAPEAYFAVSPFMHADAIDEPLLLIHGEADNNSGTFPTQSRRLFQAIKGHGGTARLVMLPNESHGYRARESVLHVLAETIDWLGVHLRAPGAAPSGFSREDR